MAQWREKVIEKVCSGGPSLCAKRNINIPSGRHSGEISHWLIDSSRTRSLKNLTAEWRKKLRNVLYVYEGLAAINCRLIPSFFSLRAESVEVDMTPGCIYWIICLWISYHVVIVRVTYIFQPEPGKVAFILSMSKLKVTFSYKLVEFQLWSDAEAEVCFWHTKVLISQNEYNWR